MNGASMGNGGRSRPLHRLRGVRDGVPRREQHPDRRRRCRRRAAARCTGSASSATGKASFPDVRLKFRPVMCQQCDAAPCEPVCPTYASHHTDEGLNAQVYNRCIGTRYCANACPVQRPLLRLLQPAWAKPLHLQLNPDVSVREVGVMEKCTFCVQRIKRRDDPGEGREARAEGRRDQAGLRAGVPGQGAGVRRPRTIPRARCRGCRARRAAASCSRISARCRRSRICSGRARHERSAHEPASTDDLLRPLLQTSWRFYAARRVPRHASSPCGPRHLGLPDVHTASA